MRYLEWLLETYPNDLLSDSVNSPVSGSEQAETSTLQRAHFPFVHLVG